MRAGWLLFAGLGVLGGCNGGGVHAFGAYHWDSVQGCLGAAQVVDVLEGPDPGPCAKVVCWVSPGGDEYVTDQACDGPPDFKTSASGPCALALAAFAKPGHTPCPASPVDAGP